MTLQRSPTPCSPGLPSTSVRCHGECITRPMKYGYPKSCFSRRRWNAVLPTFSAGWAVSLTCALWPKPRKKKILRYWKVSVTIGARVFFIRPQKSCLERHGERRSRLPGGALLSARLGDYTVAAILGIAYEQDMVSIDANVERVFSRLMNIDSPVKKNPAAALIRQEGAASSASRTGPRLQSGAHESSALWSAASLRNACSVRLSPGVRRTSWVWKRNVLLSRQKPAPFPSPQRTVFSLWKVRCCCFVAVPRDSEATCGNSQERRSLPDLRRKRSYERWQKWRSGGNHCSSRARFSTATQITDSPPLFSHCRRSPADHERNFPRDSTMFPTVLFLGTKRKISPCPHIIGKWRNAIFSEKPALRRNNSPCRKATMKHTVYWIEGDGIGPEIWK